MIWANRSLDLITIVARFLAMLFSSVGQNKRARLVTYLFRWQYTVTIWVIRKIWDSEVQWISTLVRWLTTTHKLLLKTSDSVAKTGQSLAHWAVVGLMDRALDLKPKVVGHISLLIILCIIVYVTNKAHPSLICIVYCIDSSTLELLGK